jgi:chorismate mutase/prephenate dehydrogenase
MEHSDSLPTEPLAELRDEIDTIDARLIALLGRRQRVVERVVAMKKARHLPVFHPAREEDVISDRRGQAEEIGLDPDFVEALFRTIMRRSRWEQSLEMVNQSRRPGAVVVIVGGLGEMGGFLVRNFSRAGCQVRVLDRDDWHQAAALCAGAELAVLAVPIEATAEAARRLAPFLPADCVLSDITSVKTEAMAAMLAAHPGPVVGLHPLFGPLTQSLDKQVVIATAGRCRDDCCWVVDQLADWGAVIVWAEAREHDRIMAVVQALQHFATFALGRFLRQQRIDLPRSLECSSPIYRLEMGMVGRLFAQNPSLYAEIIFGASERRQLLAAYLSSVNECATMVASGDKAAFIQAFEEIAEWFGPFADQAMRESAFLIERLIERS